MVRTIARTSLLFLSLTLGACAATPAAEQDPIREGERALLDDPEVSSQDQDLTGKPSYSVRSVAIRGEYTSEQGCAGGFDACYRVSVTRANDKLKIHFGDDAWGWDAADVWTRNGVILFSTGELDEECDDPGCGNMMKITGVIYPVKSGNAWVPQVKATYVADFPYPEYEGDNEGEIATTIRLKKAK